MVQVKEFARLLVERMLQNYFLQQGMNMADPEVTNRDAHCPALLKSVSAEVGVEAIPNETDGHL